MGSNNTLLIGLALYSVRKLNKHFFLMSFAWFSQALGKAQGEWLEKHFPKGRPEKGLTNQPLNSIEDIGITYDQSSNSRLIAKQKELVQEAIEDKQGLTNQPCKADTISN